MDEGLTEANPLRAVKQKAVYKQHHTKEVCGRALSHLQWDYVIETAEEMAEGDPSMNARCCTHDFVCHVLTRFLIWSLATTEPTMGDFRRDTMSNWWFHVVGKGNKSAKISVRDDYVLGLAATLQPKQRRPNPECNKIRRFVTPDIRIRRMLSIRQPTTITIQDH